MLSIKDLLDNPRVVLYLRATQILSAFGSFVCCLTLLGSGYYVPVGLSICGAWPSGLSVLAAILMLVFFPRPLEYWSFQVTVDLLAMTGALSAFGCLCGVFVSHFEIAAILAAVAIFTCASSHAATAACIFLLYRRQFPKSSDPLKPYLMKKEIDVWCYPVQNEQGQLFMDYQPVSSTGASKAPSEHSTRARSVRSFVRVDDEPPLETARPNSEVETTAGWSVPSQNETLQTFQRSERASTVLPAYRNTGASGRPGAG